MFREFETFGKYILVEKLASGGMAEIFLARKTGAEGLVKFLALKRILPHFSDNPEFISMFTKEAKIVLNLTHRNIVSIHEFGKENDRLFLTMDYVEGMNLRQVLKKMNSLKIKFPLEHIIYIVKEVAAGLDYAHRCIDGSTGKLLNIIHRDISPQNIMVNFEGEVKIVDFGIAKAANTLDQTVSQTLKGKFRYMSPEQASGKPVDSRTDIFALGIILWELLANRRLFTGENEIALLKKVQDCKIPNITQFNPFINVKLEKMLKKCLESSSKMRYQRAESLFKDLNKYLNRHYPDFSPHDFSDFIKNLYNKEIQNLKKRLITYVNISSEVEERKEVKNKSLKNEDVKASEKGKTLSQIKPSDKSEPLPSDLTEVTEKTIESPSGVSHLKGKSLSQNQEKEKKSSGERDLSEKKDLNQGKNKTLNIKEEGKVKSQLSKNEESEKIKNNTIQTKKFENKKLGEKKPEAKSSNEKDLLQSEASSHKKLSEDDEKTKIISLNSNKSSSPSSHENFFPKKDEEDATKIISLKKQNNQEFLKEKKSDLFSDQKKIKTDLNEEQTLFQDPSSHLEIKKTKTGEKNLKNLDKKNKLREKKISDQKTPQIEISDSHSVKDGLLAFKSKNTVKSIFAVLVLFFLIFGVYLFFHPEEKIRGKFRNNIGKISNFLPVSKEKKLLLNHIGRSRRGSNPTESKSRSVGSEKGNHLFGSILFVNSKPSGARIFINGDYIKQTTPARVEVPGSKSFSLELKKNLYRDYKKKPVFIKEGESLSINATLIKAQVAYLNINVLPKENVKVFINRVSLKKEKFPIKNHKVPALHNLKIRALDLKTNRFKEQKVRLNPGEKRTIFLNLEL